MLLVFSVSAICGEKGSLTALWKFDEGKGDTAADSSWNGNDAYIHSALWTEGVSGSALFFDGRKSFVDTRLKELPNRFSLECWYLSEEASFERVYRALLGNFGSLSKPGLALVAEWANPSPVMFYVRVRNHQKEVNLTFTQSENYKRRWHHAALTYDGRSLRLYQDGRKIREKSTSIGRIASGRSLRIGCAGPAYYFKGVIDGVAIYNRALSDEEVKRHFQEYPLHQWSQASWRLNYKEDFDIPGWRQNWEFHGDYDPTSTGAVAGKGGEFRASPRLLFRGGAVRAYLDAKMSASSSQVSDLSLFIGKVFFQFGGENNSQTRITADVGGTWLPTDYAPLIEKDKTYSPERKSTGGSAPSS